MGSAGLSSLPRSIRNTLPAVPRIIFGAIFLYSGVAKYLAVHQFTSAVVSVGVLPETLAPYVAVVVPAIELYLGCAIVLGLEAQVHTKLTVLLLAIFTAVIAVELATGAEASCGCFGTSTLDKIGPLTILRNALLLIWGLALSSFSESRSSFPPEAASGNSTVRNHPWMRSAMHQAYTMLLVLVLSSVIVMSLLLATENKTLKDRITLLTKGTLSLQPGDTALPFAGTDIRGRDMNVAFDGPDWTLLFVMKSTCADCKTTVPIWKQLAKSLTSGSISVVGVLVDSLATARSYASAQEIDFPLISVPSSLFQRSYKILATPQTILIRGHRIVQVWRGFLTKEHQLDILATMNLTALPNDQRVNGEEEL